MIYTLEVCGHGGSDGGLVVTISMGIGKSSVIIAIISGRVVIDDCVTPNVNNDVGINCHYLDGNRR